MKSKPLEMHETSESKKQRDRALWCHDLAVGAGDPTFAAKLNALAEEYEAKGLQADQKGSSDKKESRLS